MQNGPPRKLNSSETSRGRGGVPKPTFARQSSCAVTAGLLPHVTKGLCWASLSSLSFHVNFLLPFPVTARRASRKHFTKPKARAGSWSPPCPLPAQEDPLLSHASLVRVRVDAQGRSSCSLHPGSSGCAGWGRPLPPSPSRRHAPG